MAIADITVLYRNAYFETIRKHIQDHDGTVIKQIRKQVELHGFSIPLNRNGRRVISSAVGIRIPKIVTPRPQNTIS